MTAAHLINYDDNLLQQVLLSDDQIEDDLSYLMQEYDKTVYNGTLQSTTDYNQGPGAPCLCSIDSPSPSVPLSCEIA